MSRLIDTLRRRLGGQQVLAAFGVFEEIYAPTRHEALQELDRQAELPAPAPSPGDPDRDVYGARVRL